MLDPYGLKMKMKMKKKHINGFTGGDDYKEDLWTPIKLHYTEKWLKEHLIDSIN